MKFLCTELAKKGFFTIKLQRFKEIKKKALPNYSFHNKIDATGNYPFFYFIENRSEYYGRMR